MYIHVGQLYLLGFEVVTAVVMKSSIFWDITPYSPLKVSHRFGGIFRLHIQLFLLHASTLVC
jgi:hypothetical protein